jgi:predicted Zn finger-like uncharacterized protein
MYTQCPACKTVFRLHPEQIHAAHGQVRCSRCQTVFNGIENLFRQRNNEAATATTTSTPDENLYRPDTGKAIARGTVSREASAAAPEQHPDEAVEEVIADTPVVPPNEEQVAEQPIQDTPAVLAEEVETSAPSGEEESSIEETPPDTADETSAWQAPAGEAAPVELEEALPVDEVEAADKESPGPQASAGENLHLFAEEPDEVLSPFDPTAPAWQQPAEESPSLVETSAAAATMLSAEEFDDELLSIFAQKEAAAPFDAPLDTDWDEDAPRPEKPAEESAPARLSEGDTEALLSLSADTLSRDEETVFREEPLISNTSEEEPDLFRWDDPAPGFENDEDEELLRQSLPEGGALDEPDLERIEPDSAGGGAKDFPEVKHRAAAQVERTGYSLPLEQEAARGGLFGTLLWGCGIVLLLAGLALQYLYYHRLALAENASLRPLLSQLCEITGCRLPPHRELGKIVLGNHLVQSHPSYENSLLITATLVNRAGFNQPYPIVEVVMTDLGQRVVARRRFLPGEYLVGSSDTTDLSPGTEVPLMLEVVDPGKSAVGFEFNFY